MAGSTKTEAMNAGVNEVRVVGKLSAVPEARVLPSGDELVSFRVVVRRERPRGRVTVDALECAAWTAGVRRTVLGWRPGDVVEVSGALRRRFFRTAGAPASRVEIDVAKARVIARARPVGRGS